MAIMGLDISHYQETDTEFIDWPALKADPNYNFRFIWIKFQEGTLLPTDNGSYPVEVVQRQVAGAQSVNFEAINGYHFYYYQLKRFVNGVWTWFPLDPDAQAASFHEMYKISGCEIRHPMTDCEDPLIMQFLSWYDTPTANSALQFARKLNASMRDYHEAIFAEMGVRPDIYTGKWWLDPWVSHMRNNHLEYELEWMGNYRFILADYDGELNVPNYIPIDQVMAWQETSTPKPPVPSIPVGWNTPGDALDIDRWMLSDREFEIWSKGAETPPVDTGDHEERIRTLENQMETIQTWSRTLNLV